jgi:SulP family sulfate permease
MNLRKVLPILEWLPSYEGKWLGSDLTAGITLAAYAIPVSLAYASLASLPPQMGMYCYLAGGIGYFAIGSSRHLAIGPTSAISLLIGVSIPAIVGGDPSKYALLASFTAIATALAFMLAWLLRLSVLVNFISEGILTGFKAGAALVIAASQLPKLFGVSGGGDNFFERVWQLVHHLPEAHWLTLGIGAAAIAALLVGEVLAPRRPIALLVVLLSIAIVSAGRYDQQGVDVVGAIQSGLPKLERSVLDVSQLTGEELRQVLRLAAACFLLSYIESVSAARTFAAKHGYEVSPRQELLALGAANLTAGLFQGYVVAGGLSQSAVNERSGARTQLAGLFCSAAIAVVLLFLTKYFRNLPDAVLAAVVLVAVRGLIDSKELLHLWRSSRQDFAAAGVAFVGVLVLGVLDGVLVAVIASIVMLLARASRPYVAFLGRIPGTNRFSDLSRHQTNEPVRGTIVFRVQASLLYFNVEHIRAVVEKQAESRDDLSRVICDLSNVPSIDIAGARMLCRMHEDFLARNIDFKVVEAHGPVREVLRAEGLEGRVGTITRLESIADLLDPKL